MIYILCPENKMTGGTEALHQLHHYLKQLGTKSYMVYHDIDYNYTRAKVPERYLKYAANDSVVNGSDIIDDKSNLLIVSESATAMLWKYSNIKKIVWWLSVLFYDGGNLHFKNSIKHWLKMNVTQFPNFTCFKKYHSPYPVSEVMHYCASEFAYEYVTKTLKQKATKLIEPISKEFLDAGMYTEIDGRKDIVVYNPAKPSLIMKKLLERGKFIYRPIVNMTAEQIIMLFRETKLYVDFGEFPGPERIPKEAAYNGTNVLVGKRNASVNSFDVNIPDIYKVEDLTDINSIEEQIGRMLCNYKEDFTDFDIYRQQIDSLEKNFLNVLKEFKKYDWE